MQALASSSSKSHPTTWKYFYISIISRAKQFCRFLKYFYGSVKLFSLLKHLNLWCTTFLTRSHPSGSYRVANARGFNPCQQKVSIIQSFNCNRKHFRLFLNILASRLIKMFLFKVIFWTFPVVHRSCGKVTVTLGLTIHSILNEEFT